MDFTELQILRTLFRVPNLSRASRILKTSQPRMSQKLAKIENELGVKLFERTARGLQVCSAGEVLTPYAEQIATMYEEALKAVAMSATVSKQTLRIGVVHTSSPSCPSRILKLMHAWQPGTLVTVTKGTLSSLLSEFEGGELDAVLCYDPQRYGRFEWHPLFSTRISGFSSAAGRIRHEMTLKDFAGQKLVLPSRRCETRQLLDRELKKVHVNPDLAMEVDDVSLVRSIVRSGEAVALLPESTLHSIKGMVRTRITDPMITLTAGVLTKQKPSRPTRVLLSALAEGRPM